MPSLRKAGLLAGLFLFCARAGATTFGPIPVVEQARGSQYYAHGRVTSGPNVQVDQRLGRPYTYWTLGISEQPLGEPLGAQVSIRQPGGEVGDMGYHVAGTAEFTVGEDVIVALRDTDVPGVKEVVGLATGKYKLDVKDGKAVVMNGLGLPVTGKDGEPLSPDEFSALLRRVSQGEPTEADKNVWVTRRLAHEKDENPALEAEARKIYGIPERRPAEATDSTGRQAAPNPAAPKDNSVQESPPKADEASTGFFSWGWLVALAVVAGLVVGLFLALRR